MDYTKEQFEKFQAVCEDLERALRQCIKVQNDLDYLQDEIDGLGIGHIGSFEALREYQITLDLMTKKKIILQKNLKALEDQVNALEIEAYNLSPDYPRFFFDGSYFARVENESKIYCTLPEYYE